MPDESPSQPQTVVNVHLDNTNTSQATAVAEASADEKPAPPALPADPVPKFIGKAYRAFALGWAIGAHRVYLGRPVFNWLFCLYLAPLVVFAASVGNGAGAGVAALLGVGALLIVVGIEAITIPDWVRRHNRALWAAGLPTGSRDFAAAGVGDPPPSSQAAGPAVLSRLRGPTNDILRTRLLRAAHRGDGRLTVTQAVMETGESWAKVERALRKMVKKGYIDVDNAPDSGVVVYLFPELVGRPALADPGLPDEQAPA